MGTDKKGTRAPGLGGKQTQDDNNKMSRGGPGVVGR